MNPQQRPDVARILSKLKNFQRDTVEHVFQRLYLDTNPTRRFLVADEVGLGKTMVARGVIAKTIDYLWDTGRRIDIIYVCSNADIARQNLARLNLPDARQANLPTRITLLPTKVRDFEESRINFISFTPATSFELHSQLGVMEERIVLFRLLQQAWQPAETPSINMLSGHANPKVFRERLKSFDQKSINQDIAQRFFKTIVNDLSLRQRFDNLCETFERTRKNLPQEISLERRDVVGELRRRLAQSCLNSLEPDLIILDEFQRFRNLLKTDDESSQLAQSLFNYNSDCVEDPSSAARVLMLSATPYKMYTQAHESETENHYQDFLGTLEFLLDGSDRVQKLKHAMQQYRDALYQLRDRGTGGLLKIRRQIEDLLKGVMVRTERLASSSDRNGMLTEKIGEGVQLSTGEIASYLSLRRIGKALEQPHVLEYWKSAPYLLNFMDDYKLSRTLDAELQRRSSDAEVMEALSAASNETLLSPKDIQRYQRIDPANARLRALAADTVDRGVWKLLWIPPSLPYYRPEGPFADPVLKGFTKRLVFSCWKVVPKVIAATLSYEAERQMFSSSGKRVMNSQKARAKRRALLRFSFKQGRPSGMPNLALLYPCRKLADYFDPLAATSDRSNHAMLPTAEELVSYWAETIRNWLQKYADERSSLTGAEDEQWYWVAPLILDKEYDPRGLTAWFSNPELADHWGGNLSRDPEHVTNFKRGWTRHVDLAKRVADGRLSVESLGRLPADLPEVLARMALAGPGTCAWRALSRVTGRLKDSQETSIRTESACIAYSFIHLFNLPEVTYFVRDWESRKPYWRSVLEYCTQGNLQAMLDEFAHVLFESEGHHSNQREKVAARLAEEVQRRMTLRTSTVQASVFRKVKNGKIKQHAIRMRTRFAMRFGDQEIEGTDQPTRADAVRAAFNSPFWPFVLASTSIGQEGLDFHPYCHAVVHWNLPSNPVDLEQREGRVHRYKGHALRRNIAEIYHKAAVTRHPDPWTGMFFEAKRKRTGGESDLVPFWISTEGSARIERHIPVLPHSRDRLAADALKRSLVMYRMVFGQSRQEDLLHYLSQHFSPEEIPEIAKSCWVDLSPPHSTQTGVI